MRHASLFSGIGGFDLAAQWMGWENVFHCEYDPFCQKVLNHHFPNSKLYKDVRTFDATAYAGRIDILTGGFPCQPFSAAGKRLGTEDSRHLWPSMLRIIREVKPRYVVGENVRGLLSWSGGLVFEEVCSDLEAEGYEVTPYLLPACGKNAPHLRFRIWFVAYSNECNDRRTSRQDESEGREERVQERNEVRKFSKPGEVFGDAPDTTCKRLSGQREQPIGGVERQFERSFSEGNAPDTTCVRRGEDVRKSNGESNECNEISENGDAPDTKCNGLEYGKNQREVGSRQEKICRQGNKSSRKSKTESEVNKWETFPTQPPICGGDDGLPKELDGITFPKWRKESIKAYGNAIVPQVAHEIFKAIQKTIT